MKLSVTVHAVVVSATLAGCAASTEEPGIVLVDEGALCVLSEAPELLGPPLVLQASEQRFEPGDRLHVTVAVPTCMSASCDVDRHASCAVERRGATLSISSYLAYEHTPAESCSRDCGTLSASCRSEPLEAGAYEVVHGARVVSLVVPSSLAAPCMP
jgi:hypothetical protein